jgi:hypothetical protein
MATYRVTREGDILGEFSKEGLQRALSEGRLLATDRAFTQGMQADQSLDELGFKSITDRMHAPAMSEPPTFKMALIALGVAPVLFSVVTCWDNVSEGWKSSLVVTLVFTFFILALKERKAWAHFIVTTVLGLLLLPSLFFIAALPKLDEAPLMFKTLMMLVCTATASLFFVFNSREVRAWCNRKVP